MVETLHSKMQQNNFSSIVSYVIILEIFTPNKLRQTCGKQRIRMQRGSRVWYAFATAISAMLVLFRHNHNTTMITSCTQTQFLSTKKEYGVNYEIKESWKANAVSSLLRKSKCASGTRLSLVLFHTQTFQGAKAVKPVNVNHRVVGVCGLSLWILNKRRQERVKGEDERAMDGGRALTNRTE